MTRPGIELRCPGPFANTQLIRPMSRSVPKLVQPLYHHHHHHHVVPLAWTSLTLSCHSSLSFIASGRSSGLHPLSSKSCCMYVRAGHPAFVRQYEGVKTQENLVWTKITFKKKSFQICTMYTNILRNLIMYRKIMKYVFYPVLHI